MAERVRNKAYTMDEVIADYVEDVIWIEEFTARDEFQEINDAVKAMPQHNYENLLNSIVYEVLDESELLNNLDDMIITKLMNKLKK